ncbi:MAG: matrixin family metalloprotease [Myxococcota bacterium]
MLRNLFAVPILGFVIFSMPSTASAFVCSRVVDQNGDETGPSLSWFTRQIPFSIYESGTADIAGNAEFTALRASFRVWENAQEGSQTTDISFVEQPLSTRPQVGYNFLDPSANENLLIFYDDVWPHQGQGNNIIALTTTTHNALTGEIFDADIEYNSATFTFSVSDLNPITDLMNTTVHEIGHVLGLGHSLIGGATMFASAQPGDTSKRDLHDDDIQGVLFKYPAGEDLGYCVPTVACGFCAPPNELTADAIVTVLRQDDGMSSGGCSGTNHLTGSSGLALFLLFWRFAWRRFPTCRRR